MPAVSKARGKLRRPREQSKGYPPADVVGRTIVAVRPMTEKEAQQERWPYFPHMVPSVLELDNGVVLFPAADDNGRAAPAHLIGNTAENKPFALVSEMEAGTALVEETIEQAPRAYRKALPRVAELGTARCPR